MVTAGPVGQNQFISKAPPRFQVADLEASAEQQLFRIENSEGQLMLVCTGSPLVGRPTRLNHRHCASELGYAESTARFWSGGY